MLVKMLSNIHQKILGHPFFYDHIRPLIVGGQDVTPVYDRIQINKDDVVLDVGCSTGVFFDYCQEFQEYHGLDLDTVALDVCRGVTEKLELSNCHFHSEILTNDLVQQIQPTKVMLGGILHFLNDDEIHSLMQALLSSSRLEGVVSYDAAYYKGKYINNLYAYATRGKHNRVPHGYTDLISSHAFDIKEEFHVTTGNGAMTLFCMHFRPKK